MSVHGGRIAGLERPSTAVVGAGSGGFCKLVICVRARSEVEVMGLEVSRAFIDWTETTVSVDLLCQCGVSTHFHGQPAHRVRCSSCGVVYALGSELTLAESGYEEHALEGTPNAPLP